jgi:hypothetical protein
LGNDATAVLRRSLSSFVRGFHLEPIVSRIVLSSASIFSSGFVRRCALELVSVIHKLAIQQFDLGVLAAAQGAGPQVLPAAPSPSSHPLGVHLGL